MSATKDEIIAAQAQQIVEQQARIEELITLCNKVIDYEEPECVCDETVGYVCNRCGMQRDLEPFSGAATQLSPPTMQRCGRKCWRKRQIGLIR